MAVDKAVEFGFENNGKGLNWRRSIGSDWTNSKMNGICDEY